MTRIAHKVVAGLAAGFFFAALSAAAAAPARQRLARLATIVYITAHPDDESGPVISYLARGLGARVVILCLTRGEGGQNLDGPELDAALGVVRTGELERATAVYGAELRFLGAVDFGYSKSVEEVFRHWDREKLAGELAAEIRRLRPLAVITRWTGLEADGGGAQHRAAGLLARGAYEAAGDPAAYPEQLAHGLTAWPTPYLLLHARDEKDGAAFEVPVGEASPVAEKTFEDLGWEGFSNHRSQGMHGRTFPRGRRYFLRTEASAPGAPPLENVNDLAPPLGALPEFFRSVNVLPEWRSRLEQVVALAGSARALAAESKPAEAALALVQGAALVAALRREILTDDTTPETDALRALLEDRHNEILQTAAALSGAELEARADRAVVAPGDSLWVGLTAKVAAPEVFAAAGFKWGGLQLVAPPDWSVEPAAATAGAETAGLPAAEKRAEFSVTVPGKWDPARAAAPLRARATLTTGSLSVVLEAVVEGLAAGGAPTLEPVSVAPAVTLELEPALQLLPASPSEMVRDFRVEVTPLRARLGELSVWFDVPTGWYNPLPQFIKLEKPGAPASFRFSVTLPERAPPGRYTLRAGAGKGLETYSLARRRLPNSYGYEPARAELLILDVAPPRRLRVGFLGFANDPAPALLAQLGVTTDILDEKALAAADLNAYDALLVAARALEFRADLAGAKQRLLDYVSGGGTLVVEQQGGRGWEASPLAPFPFKSPGGNLRVTDELAPVRVLDSEHTLLNFPHKIGEADWQGWTQERGLYFWESWDANYTPLLELREPGEAVPLQGALLYARHGQGVYIYSALGLSRQLRAGVPGAIRLLLNLLSQRRAPPPAQPLIPPPAR